MDQPERVVAEVYLQPGEHFLAIVPTIIWTILGSCVAAAFWCEKLNAGALCHAMLPVCPQLSAVSSGAGYRYMDYAIREIVRQFDGLGARRTDIQIKLFGGADVLLDSRTPSAKATVGKLNVETALEVLAKERLQVVASSVGGNHGRKIYFNTGTGEVLLRRLAATTIKKT